MEAFVYNTLESPSEGLYKEKGSKFLSFAFPVSSEEQIKDLLDQFKKQYYDARHVCFAYILGYQKDRYRAYDDGEPNHSAGDPILNQIKSFDLSDTLVIVVRYFGGTKLGVGGLITAYKTATQEALENAKVIEKIPTEVLKHHFKYEEMNHVMSVIKQYDLKVLQQKFELSCEIILEIPLFQTEVIKQALNIGY